MSEEYPLTESECISAGGHCWERAEREGGVSPEAYSQLCKHCGKHISWEE